jgi:hypothetical protein
MEVELNPETDFVLILHHDDGPTPWAVIRMSYGVENGLRFDHHEVGRLSREQLESWLREMRVEPCEWGDDWEENWPMSSPAYLALSNYIDGFVVPREWQADPAVHTRSARIYLPLDDEDRTEALASSEAGNDMVLDFREWAESLPKTTAELPMQPTAARIEMDV